MGSSPSAEGFPFEGSENEGLDLSSSLKSTEGLAMAEPLKINWISELTIVAKATLIQLARTSVVPRVKSRLKPQKTEIE